MNLKADKGVLNTGVLRRIFDSKREEVTGC
jgi:hypothetical protein